MSTIDSSQVKSKLRDIVKQTPEILDVLLAELAKAIRADARQRVPVETGHLRRSIRYKKIATGQVMIYAQTAGGAVSREYAARVHEDLDTPHQRGEAKYIERPLLELGAGEMAEYIARELLKRLAANQSLAGAWRSARDNWLEEMS